MKTENYIIGKLGEEEAIKFLTRKNYRLIEKNFRCNLGEIDVICEDSGSVVFVEVKLKIGDRFGIPEEMVTRRKLQKVTRVAQMWLLSHRGMPKYRIDVVAIVLGNDKEIERIDHYINVGAEFC